MGLTGFGASLHVRRLLDSTLRIDPRMNGIQDERLAAERAADWIARLKNAAPQDRAAFVRWMKESPKHVRDALLASALEIELRRVDPERKFDIEQLASSSNVVHMHADAAARPSNPVPLWRWVAGFGLVAAVAAAVGLGWSGRLDAWLRPNLYATAVGELRSVELKDGSVVSLNAQSQVRVAYSDEARDVYLEAGQALFVVEHDAERPFRVHAGDATVVAVGTKFDVHRLADRTNVAVIEGVVEVESGSTQSAGAAPSVSLENLAERTRLEAGQGVTITPAGVTAPAVLDVSEVSAWQQRRLIFRNHTLDEIVHEFARYNRTPHIRVEGAALRAKRLSGVFYADDLDSFVASLGADASIEMERRGAELVIRERASGAASAEDSGDPVPAVQ
jgi:transmembrane sensor